MKTSTISLGICKNARCNIGGNQPVDRYDGPGMFCPNCGELLQKFEPGEGAGQWVLQAPARDAFVSQGANATVPEKSLASPRSPVVRRILVGATCCAAIFLVAAVIIAGVFDRAHAGAANVIGICASSMSERLASDVLHAYKSDQPRLDHFEVRSANCDVRFGAVNQATSFADAAAVRTAIRPSVDLGGPIAYDAVVAIVNPQNSVATLSVDQLREIFSGSIKSWHGISGSNSPITVYAPAENTDESRFVTTNILRRSPFGSSVIRLASSAEVVRAVAAPNGRMSIGVVAFSQAVPGKVVAVKNYAPPSILSISEQRYPFTLGITVASSTSDPSVPELLHFTTSESAKAVAVRDGFVR